MEDRLLLSTFQVTNTKDDGNPGSLRWAIGQANGGSGGDTISFQVNPGAGVQTIQINSPLPAITVPVTIDATTEPNYAGTPLIQLDGTNAGSRVDGLSITAGGTAVLGLSIVNFNGNGISITGNGGNRIQADYLGIDADGTTAAPNGGDGLFVGTSNNLVGGLLPDQANLISGNLGYGIEFNGGNANTVQGNQIGVDASGTLARGNLGGGILVKNSLADTIGGTSVEAENVISGNGSHGIETFGSTDGLTIQGNHIGTDASATRNLGNHGDGIHLFSGSNTIGGLNPNEANVIAYNGNSVSGSQSGIGMVLNVTNNSIYSNSIFSNLGLGISLGGTGNHNQPSPVLSAASTDGTTSILTGSLSGSVPNSDYNIQFFSNQTADPSGFGEGEHYLATVQVHTDGAGNASFNSMIPVAFLPGTFISATATDSAGNTSEFARDIRAQGNADVQVTLDPDMTSVTAGDKVTYTLRVNNNGTTIARGVTAINQIPAGTTLVSATSDQATVIIGSGTVTFEFGTLSTSSGGIATIVVQTSDASVPAITDAATVTSLEGDPNASNNSATVVTTVSPVTDLAVTVSGSPASVPVGQNVTYTVTLTNNGPAQATNVLLSDTLPQNVTLVSASSTQGTTSLNGNVVTTAIPALDANGAPVVLTIVVSTSAATASLITDAASVSANETDSNPDNNSATTSTMVTPVADVGVTVQASPNSVQVGQNVTYTVTVTNRGPSPATGVVITDVLPANVTFVSAVDSVGGNPTQAGGTVTDPIPTLLANGVVTLTIVVSTSAATAASITDTASVVAVEPDPNTANDNASVTTTVSPVTDLAVTMLASPGGVDAGGNVTYDITVKNDGPSQATGVTLTDSLPAGVTIVSVNASQGSTSQGSGSVTANIGNLGPNVSATLSIVVATSAGNTPSITNAVSAVGNEFDPVTGNNTASTTTSVTPATDLSVTITPSTDPVLVDQNLTYTVTVTNNGPSPATGVELTDTLPLGFTFVSAVDSLGNTLSETNGSVIDHLGAMDSGATVTLTIVVTATTPGQAFTSATVSGNETDPDSNNNTALVTSSVLPAVDLSVNLAADQSQVTTGNVVTYTATVTNHGPSPATDVVLKEILSGGATVLTISASQGSTSHSGAVVTAALGDLAVGATATLTIVVSATKPGIATAQVSAAASELDTDSADDTASVKVQVVDPPGTLQFSSPIYSVNENARYATLVVTRTGGSQGVVSVKYWTRLTGSATPGVDFTAVSGTLTFQQGETFKTIIVPVLDNPHDKHDETVGFYLAAPRGGALLGPQRATTLVIHDIDPDNSPPRVLETRLYGTATSIVDVTLFFSEGLNPATAWNPSHFQIIDAGPDGRIGTRDDRGVAIRHPMYNPSNNTVILQPAVPLTPNEFYYVRVTGVTDLAGNPLAAGAGALPGGGFGTYVARGTNLQYSDSRGSLVSIKLSGGGVLDLTRYANGEGQRLQVLNPIPFRSRLSGSVRGGTGVTTLDSMTGLGVFGQVKMSMSSPPFYVVHLPFNHTIISPPAVDGVMGSGGVGVSRALKARRGLR